ncbi:hypothetical protein QBC40DRAFT_298614 [Triangularia verruculosa]|uniref:Uncharacterized protein n=1 Tax=Triangularia verruculosa TaxID=2587418 RepID=A0AAN7ARA7_9PEZI|nr:hypothetical protein QBC40DRAFT_298614 [Triangularia verruculosa]
MVPAETTAYYPVPPVPTQPQQRPLGRAASMGRLDPIPPPDFTSSELRSGGVAYEAYNPVHSMSQDAIPPVPRVSIQFPPSSSRISSMPLAAASQGYRAAAMPRPAVLRSQAARGYVPGSSMAQRVSRPLDRETGGARSVSDSVLTPFLARADLAVVPGEPPPVMAGRGGGSGMEASWLMEEQ